MKWIVAFALLISFAGCKFVMKDFKTSIGEIQSEVENLKK